MRKLRDFGVQFWIIAAIDFFDFQPSSCIARVPTKTLTSRLRSKRSDSR